MENFNYLCSCFVSTTPPPINNLLSKSFGISSLSCWHSMAGRDLENTSIPQPVDCDTLQKTPALGLRGWHINCDRRKFCSMRLRLTKSEREQQVWGKGRCFRVFNIYEQYVATVENARAQDVPRTHLPSHPTSHRTSAISQHPYIAYSTQAKSAFDM